MQQAHVPLSGAERSGLSEPVAGVIGGVVAGAAYLLAQVSFTAAVRAGGAAEPLQRIAAILMGADAAPPPSEFNFTILGMALIIHFALSMVFGRVVSVLTWKRRMPVGVLYGALAGVALYAVNFGLIAPAAFPWFNDSVRVATFVDHALFGAVAALVCLTLRDRRSGVTT